MNRGRTAIVALAAALGPVVLFFLFHLSSSMDHRITVVPDDGLYYLLLGKNFAEHHVWSFDGVTTTSGFHLLQGYVCALVAFVLRGASTETLLDVLAFVGLGVTVFAVFVLVRTFARALSPAAALGVAFVSGSANFVQQPVSVMEWPWVVLASALLVAASSQTAPASHSPPGVSAHSAAPTSRSSPRWPSARPSSSVPARAISRMLGRSAPGSPAPSSLWGWRSSTTA
jgi:hypothetical protein